MRLPVSTLGRLVLRYELRQASRPLRPTWDLYKRWISTGTLITDATSIDSTTRNIGIIAHIDAGKTTTTERMLYYSGHTSQIGNVDEGSTVTDFLPTERARGITIQSAAVTFHWPPLEGELSPQALAGPNAPHTINLIDTPGHADFAFEVVRTLRILDGAVCILDGVAGVEAQTERVWAQASNYSIPRIVYVNKLDRDGADFGRCVQEIGTILKGLPAVCQIPWWEFASGNSIKFIGVGDVINLCGLKWVSEDGKAVKKFTLEELGQSEPELRTQLVQARKGLIDALCSHDEILLETWMACGDRFLEVPADDIRDSLHRCILGGSASLVPVFAGASFKNIGVQPLLDAINYLLPNPSQRPDPEVHLGSEKGGLQKLLDDRMSVTIAPTHQVSKKKKKKSIKPASVANIECCALAFKVVNDSRRGVLVYVRVYSGTLERNANLWNTNLQATERAQRLLQMYASEAKDIMSIDAGQIGVIRGYNNARTGDTLVSYHKMDPKVGPPNPYNSIQLRPIDVPPPVFFVAVAPDSLSEKKDVEEKLDLLLREDPSLQLKVVEETGQTLLSGMGELHLEIARDRLVKDFKAKATFGSIEISYRECLLSPTGRHRYLFDREVAGKKAKAGCEATIEPLSHLVITTPETYRQDGNAVTLRMSYGTDEEAMVATARTIGISKTAIRKAFLDGAYAGLARGPRKAFPTQDCHLILDFDPLKDFFGAETTAGTMATTACLAVQAALKAALGNKSVAILEPVMEVVISCDENSAGTIVRDLESARGGKVLAFKIPDLHDSNNVNLNDVYIPPNPYGSGGIASLSRPGQSRTVIAKVPLKEMVGYWKHLRSMTAGRGTFVMSVSGFERVTGLREKALENSC